VRPRENASGKSYKYYPFACPPERKRRRGLQTANSWTRENITGNNFLANGGTELNPTTSLYDLDFRNYDPVLGRMHGVDPMATKYASLSPYNYAFNNPVTFNDVSGADPYTINHSASNSQYYTAYTYDDRIDYTPMGEYICGQCWRMEAPGAMAFYGAATGYGSSMFGMGAGWKPGDSRISWSPFEAGYRQLVADAAAVKSGQMSLDRYISNYGTSYGGGIDGLKSGLASFGIDLKTLPGTAPPSIQLDLLDPLTQTEVQDDVVTQKDLIEFVSKNPSYKKYPANWILDSDGIKTSKTNPGKTIPTFSRKNGNLTLKSIDVYIHPSAFGTITDFRQTLVIGHEFIHVMHLSSGSFTRWIGSYGWSGAEAISEYWSYKWQVENENRLGYPIGGQIGLDKWTKLLPAGYTSR
jgi:RHS repeat-associated protein